MTSPIVAPPLAGNVLGSDANDFVVAEWRDPGTPAGPPRLIAPLHLHRKDDEAWYILEGTLRVRVGNEEVERLRGPGSSPEAAHLLEPEFRAGPLPAGDERERLSPDPGNSRDEGAHSPALRAVFQKYDSELPG